MTSRSAPIPGPSSATAIPSGEVEAPDGDHSTVLVSAERSYRLLVSASNFTSRESLEDRYGRGSTDIDAPATGTALDVRLRAALRRAETQDRRQRQAEWADEVSAAVYSHGTAAVHLLREYWREGSLRGDALEVALIELGYMDESLSHATRRALLLEALSVGNSDVRSAASQALIYLADPSVAGDLSRLRRTEANSAVRAQIEDAINTSSPGRVLL